MAGGESGMFQYPPIGTRVEIAFEGSRPDKPFIRQTLSQGNTLPDIKPGEQLQQQRAEVSQRVTQEGSWVRQTDQTINESSMHREVRADTETRTLVARETTVQATDKATVLGKSTLLAGAIQQVNRGLFIPYETQPDAHSTIHSLTYRPSVDNLDRVSASGSHCTIPTK